MREKAENHILKPSGSPSLALQRRDPHLHADRPGLASLGSAIPECEAVEIRCGRGLFVFYDARPTLIAQRLECSEFVHQLFHSIAHLDAFLASAGANECVSDDRWRPLVVGPLSTTTHLQRWLDAISPISWPWAQVRGGAGGELVWTLMLTTETSDALLIQFTRELLRLFYQGVEHQVRLLATTYAQHPTAEAVLDAGQRPLRVMIVANERSSYQKYCARDMGAAFGTHGFTVGVHMIKGNPAAQYELLASLNEFRPDVLMCNGTGRSSYTGLPENLSVWSWDQDYVLVASVPFLGAFRPRDRLWVMVREWLEDLPDGGLPQTRSNHLNLGTDPKLYYPLGVPSEPEHEVLFVGNIFPFDEYRKYIEFDFLHSNVQTLLLHARERLEEWVVSRSGEEPFIIPDCTQWLHASADDLGTVLPEQPGQRRRLVYYFRYRVAHFVLREAYVRALSEFDLALYGRGWEQFEGIESIAQPPIANGPDLREAIQRSAINIHLHTWTVHHPRLYDTAAAGGFLLVGRVPEFDPLETVFEVGEELDTFGSIEEMKQQIRRYLDTPDRRQTMAAAAARRAKRDHSMSHRMGAMIRSVKSNASHFQKFEPAAVTTR